MRLHATLFVSFIILHLLAPFIGFEQLAVLAAGSVYFPLLPLHWVSLPVFAAGAAAGWAPPAFFGWFVIITLWTALWWQLGGGITRLLQRKATAGRPMEETEETSPLFHLFATTAVNSTALLLYGVGLLSPLTPSVGRSSFIEVLLLAGLPCALLLVCAWKARRFAAKAFFFAQSTVVVGFTGYLLWQQF